MKTPVNLSALALLTLLTLNPSAHAQGTSFTYQGRLASGGTAANGLYNLAFTLFATNTAAPPSPGR